MWQLKRCELHRDQRLCARQFELFLSLLSAMSEASVVTPVTDTGDTTDSSDNSDSAVIPWPQGIAVAAVLCGPCPCRRRSAALASLHFSVANEYLVWGWMATTKYSLTPPSAGFFIALQPGRHGLPRELKKPGYLGNCH